MRDDRRRTLEGRHQSVGGEAAEEVLALVIGQFADKHVFIRELIQNSLDAAAARIDVRMWMDEGELCVAVADDGDGMDRALLEGYLLTLFRSTKEDDLTKIGKFGIGFASIFAMRPREVVVDTGRHGVWHRLVFDAGLTYTLSRRREPYEGTTVTLRVPDATIEDARRIREAAVRWCRFADAAISLSGLEEGAISAPFAVDGPVSVPVTADGVRGVIAPGETASFYNRGILLWEGETPVPGLAFRVDGRHLEHTLTRDNVNRGPKYEAVIEVIRSAVPRLDSAVHQEAEVAAHAGDLPRIRRLYDAIGEDVPWDWDDARPILPGASGAVSLGMLRQKRSWLGRLRGDKVPVAWSSRPRMGEKTAVLLAASADDVHVRFACAMVGGVPVELP